MKARSESPHEPSHYRARLGVLGKLLRAPSIAGFAERVLVEVKLSTNARLFDEYSKQLTTYKQRKRPAESYYLINDAGQLGTKMNRIDAETAKLAKSLADAPEIRLVNGEWRASVSKQ